MKTVTGLMVLASAFAATGAEAVEQAEYSVVERQGEFELRDYPQQILAEVIVEGGVEDAGNLAFGRLFRYISGGNRTRTGIDMTSPVNREPRGEKIAMTAPVAQAPAEGGWAVSFLMPAARTLDTLPVPNDPAVALRKVPARRMAAVRYSGTWSKKGYREHLLALSDWLKQSGLQPAGKPVWARYDPPFKPWFLRRNEVLIPVETP